MFNQIQTKSKRNTSDEAKFTTFPVEVLPKVF